jgi:Reverse transcriptase (RNA-dependent DNA polymerase)
MRRGSTGPAGRSDRLGIRSVPVPKPGGGTRWLTVLDPVDQAEYRAAMRPLAGRIERSLGPEVLAIRTSSRGEPWTLAPWAGARASWRRSVRRAIEEATATFAVADVRDCYGSISPETLAELLGPEAAHAITVLRRFRERGVRGLPIGPEPSAILANAVLSRLDDAIRSTGVRHLRWVDDIVLWGQVADVRAAMRSLPAAAAAVGLDLHHDKTRILEDRSEGRVVLLGDRDSSIIAAP